jgi:hypothetical protein
MIPHLDSRVNELFKINEDIKKAGILEERAQFKSKVADGLAQSCLLLRDMLDDEVLGTLGPDSKAVQTLKALEHGNRLEEFLKVERALLEVTKLSQSTIDELIYVLQWVVRLNQFPIPKWKTNLKSLTDQICLEASASGRSAQGKQLLKRAFVAGGGALVGILNALPPPGVPIPPSFSTISITAATWLISEAAGNQLSEYFER